MCGIGLLWSPQTTGQHDGITATESCLCDCWDSLLDNIQCRGPDSFEVHTLTRPDEARRLRLASSVLSLRGSPATIQPLRSAQEEGDKPRFWLCWNGQIFDWAADAASTSRLQVEHGANDGQVLFDALCSATNPQDSKQVVVSTLALVEGPYAFVFVDRRQRLVVFGRDPLGRRSLLLCRDHANTHLAVLSVTSTAFVGHDHTAVEVGCASLWTFSLDEHPQSLVALPRDQPAFLLRELKSGYKAELMSSDENISAFRSVLSLSVRQRVTTIETAQADTDPRLAILFSGGLDCTTLALLAGEFVSTDQPIDLLNVAFENPRAIQAAKRLQEIAVSRKARRKQHQEVEEVETAGEDLHDPDEYETVYNVPDRVTGRASYQELCRLQPDREWRFVEIDVPYQSYCETKATVEALMWPSKSVIDLSIASALYFASQSIGTVTDSQTGLKTPYTSQAKVMLSGLGADELLGGYSRHRASFVKSGKLGLVQELQMDLDRLPERNLGRDDRVLSHHGKEARYPFLDRKVIDFLTSIPVEAKVDLNTLSIDGAGGDKALLRCLAASLGLTNAAQLKKRAMQFGTRVAKIDNESRHAKGHHSLKTLDSPSTLGH